MKNLNKTLLAVALLAAGTGAANASIVQASGTVTSATAQAAEAFMQVYDSTQGVTYNLDLGITLAQLNAGLANGTSFNLSTDANWTAFHGAKFNAATTSYGVVDGYRTQDYFTSNLANPAISTANLTNVGSAIQTAAGRINSGVALVAGSSLAVDGVNDGTGQWQVSAGSLHSMDDLFGAPGGTLSASANYGSAINFFFDTYNTVTKVNSTTLIGSWTLAGNTLSFATPTITPPAAVPLPAAVWMFGAGLMGVLRLNRRKSAAI